MTARSICISVTFSLWARVNKTFWRGVMCFLWNTQGSRAYIVVAGAQPITEREREKETYEVERVGGGQAALMERWGWPQQRKQGQVWRGGGGGGMVACAVKTMINLGWSDDTQDTFAYSGERRWSYEADCQHGARLPVGECVESHAASVTETMCHRYTCSASGLVPGENNTSGGSGNEGGWSAGVRG